MQYIVGMKKLEIPIACPIFALRQINTEVCIDLVLEALENYEQLGSISSQNQSSKGRYYSFMPAVLKDIIIKKFHRFTTYNEFC